MSVRSTLAALALMGAPGLAHAALPPAGESFSLTVNASFEKPFTDCWTFNSSGQYITSHTNLGSFPYQLDALNTQANAFQAVWEGHNSIGFGGTINGTTLTGNGTDARDRTYSFTGTQVGSCAGFQPSSTDAFRIRR
jgi:hypothetical protein